MKNRSQEILKGPEWANVRALYKSSGYTDKELTKPIVAIVNSFNSICPGHVNLRQLADRVRDGINAAGGTAVEFGTIGACDGIAMGHDGMKYVLPTREMIADDVEAMMEAHRLDGMVLLGSCDKIIPGMLLGAARLNLPTILLNGGPTLPGRMTEGNPYGGDSIDHSVIQQSEGALKANLIDVEEFTWIENNAVPTIGSCAMLGTANTMSVLAEAMGISLPGSASIPAVYSRRNQIAYETGIAVMGLIEKEINAKDIINRSSLINAIRVNAAIGGSSNAVMHLLALAYEAEVDLDIFELGDLSSIIPHLVPLIPAGAYTLLDFHEAGGVPALMKEISAHLHLETLICTGRTLKEHLLSAGNHNKDVIRELSDAAHKFGGVGILRGNLAPEGAVTKPSAIPEDAHLFTGPAKIYESEQDSLIGIRTGMVIEGDVVVIRNQGPKGGPGMPEMYKAMKLLVGMDLGSRVCVITDGRFSGSNNGCFVGHICPEAYDNGPIAYLKNGDIISVNIQSGTIDAPDVDFGERRREGRDDQRRNPVKGVLFQYRKNVESASRGAIIPTR